MENKLKHTEKEKKAIKELSRKLSKYFGEEFKIGSDAVPIEYSGFDQKEVLREWFKLGREEIRLAKLHDKNTPGQ